jgi:hypothetical protein
MIYVMFSISSSMWRVFGVDSKKSWLQRVGFKQKILVVGLFYMGLKHFIKDPCCKVGFLKLSPQNNRACEIYQF